ncbi:MAG: hypothetical protein ACI828_002314 [Flavobacteriales bacterium]|jgi:hypothetical protein
MKNKFIQTLSALILPISFIGFLSFLNIGSLNKYELGGIPVTGIALLRTYLAL